MSFVDVATPADKGKKRLGPLGKLGVGAGGVVVAFVLATSPSIWGTGMPAPEDDKVRREPVVAKPFEPLQLGQPEQPAQQVAAPGHGAPSGMGQRGGAPSGTAARVAGASQERPKPKRSIPPPIAISTHSGDIASTSDANRREGGQSATASYAAPQMPSQQQRSGEASSTSLSGQLEGGVELGPVKAGFDPNPEYMIYANAKIPCLPVETYNSALGGFVECRVPEWVRGDTLTRGLLPPGTRVLGQIRGGMAQGQPRLGVLYSRIITSGDRMTIRMSGLGADAQGRSGLDADIETFFWETAGAVGLYSLIQATTTAIPLALQALLQQGNNNTFVGLGSGFSGGGSGGSQGLANRLLADRLNKQPQAERDWAMPMFVTVGQDLDFYDVCKRRQRVNQMACPVISR
jgi:type IV secretion system protein VirB10